MKKRVRKEEDLEGTRIEDTRSTLEEIKTKKKKKIILCLHKVLERINKMEMMLGRGRDCREIG